MRVVLIFTRRSTLSSDVYIFLVISTYFWFRLLHFFVISVPCVLLMNGTAILLWVRMWCIFFSMSVMRSYVELMGYWRLDFVHVSFGTSFRKSEVNPPGSWWLDFGLPGSWLMLGIFSPIPWLIYPRVGMKMIQWLTLWSNSWLVAVWWIGGWCLVKRTISWFFLGPSKWILVLVVFDPWPNIISCILL